MRLLRPGRPGRGSARVGVLLSGATAAGAALLVIAGFAAPRPIATHASSATDPGPAGAAARASRPAMPPQDSLPGEVTVRRLAGGARLAFYRQPAQDLVALRMSFPLSTEDGPPEALARIAQGLAGQALAREAATYGARISLERTASYASFGITGAAADLPALAGALQRAVAWGDWSEQQVATARLVAATRARRDVETPEPLLRRRLAAQLFPALPPEADSVPGSLTAGALHRFWAHSFAPARMQAVVVGAVTEAQASAALGDWPEPRPPGETAEEAPAPDSATADSLRASGRVQAAADTGRASLPQVLFPWAAVGWTAAAPPAAVAVAARLVQERLAAQPLRYARAELWWWGDARALVTLGSATRTGDPAAPGVAAALDAGVAAAAAALSPEDVARARLAVARDILFSARSPEGLARFLGELFERTGDPAAGQAFLRALDRVDAAAVGAALKGLGEAVVAEVKP